MRLGFEGTGASVEIADDALLRRAIACAADRWPHGPVAAASDPASTVTRLGRDDYLLEAPGQDPVRDDALCVACAMMIDVVQAVLAEQPDMLSFHCAAVEIGGSLLLIPSRGHAGKSTLVARLAAEGIRIWCDDILPVAPGDREGLALGIAPRLRLPLPKHTSPGFRAFVSRHLSVDDGAYGYLRLPDGQLARHGETARLGRILILDRREGARAELGRASRSDALRALIGQNQTMRSASGALLDRLHAMMDRLPAYVLRYHDLEEAAALVTSTFASPLNPSGLPRLDVRFIDGQAGGDGSPVPFDGGLGNSHSHPGAPSNAIPVPEAARWRRAPGIVIREVDGDVFLSDPGGARLFHLNAMGAGLWSVLEHPTSLADAAEMFATAFPDVQPQRIRTDLAVLFGSLAAAGLVEAPLEAPGSTDTGAIEPRRAAQAKYTT